MKKLEASDVENFVRVRGRRKKNSNHLVHHTYSIAHTTDRPSRRAPTFIKRLHQLYTLTVYTYIYLYITHWHTHTHLHTHTHTHVDVSIPLQCTVIYACTLGVLYYYYIILYSLSHTFCFFGRFSRDMINDCRSKTLVWHFRGRKTTTPVRRTPLPFLLGYFCTHAVINCLGFPIGLRPMCAFVYRGKSIILLYIIHAR